MDERWCISAWDRAVAMWLLDVLMSRAMGNFFWKIFATKEESDGFNLLSHL